MSHLDEQLRRLVEEACKHPPGSFDRQRCLTQIIRLTSGKLWRENVPYYQDALQKTWVYFCQHLCERGTGERYDPNRSGVITWLNYYLRRRLQDGFIEVQSRQKKFASVPASSDDERLNPVDLVPANPDVPPILDEVRSWAETDASGELRRVHIEGCPQVNCQVLILRRLPPETSWKALSEEFGVAVPTLSSFYQRQCLPRLRKFGESEGYI
ncbi:sigma-70 family RNA polymerase sigma factor [Kovacikia minuta CCNUW1]|uniref:sigma-70 family RNA polymerase sigma factor n=1 Tax=Kovacikia minuta TaxID=2931930 RepID=UPI001CCA8F97|nr:sigma-70 family RNA polymerase sigma factor [Kovacikia minuta]UBF23748.1 sigma-70 family RNA polymerase sigma factor [Kovacikia minuta CCNUW1]